MAAGRRENRASALDHGPGPASGRPKCSGENGPRRHRAGRRRHRRDDHVLKPEPMGRFATHRAHRRATPRASRGTEQSHMAGCDVAQDHERRGTAGIAFGAIGAAGVFADGLQLQFTQQMVRERILIADGQWPFEPRRQAAGVGQLRQESRSKTSPASLFPPDYQKIAVFRRPSRPIFSEEG